LLRYVAPWKKIDLDPASQIFCIEGNWLNARSPNPHTDNIKNFTVGGTKLSKDFEWPLFIPHSEPTLTMVSGGKSLDFNW
jgi:hypothetical protein